MTTYKTLMTRTENKVLHLTLNRPDSLNAIDLDMMEELTRVFYMADMDDDIRAVLLSGAGRAFCAGGDVKAFSVALANPESGFRGLAEKLHQGIVAMRRLKKPIIAAINGSAAGAGMSLAMACDILCASEEAYFSTAYSKIGLSPDGSSTFFLPRALGPHQAMYYFLTAEKIPAAQAHALGLVQRLYKDKELYPEATAFAENLAKGPTLCFAKTKHLINQTYYTPLESQLAEESACVFQTATSQDFFEGVMAFVEKRKPEFNGH